MTEVNCVAKPRKSLADQIDRLDSILDGLSEELGLAVADAVRVAVKDAVVAALTNPEVLAALRNAHPAAQEEPTPVPERKSWWSGVKDWATGAWNSVTGWCTAAWQKVCQTTKACQERVSDGCGRLGHRCQAGWATMAPWLELVWRARLPLLLALLVAVAFGLAGFFCGPWVAAVVFGLGGFAMAVTGLVVWGLWMTVPKLKTLPWAEVPDARQSGDLVPPATGG